MSADQVQRLRAERFDVLRQVYQQTEGSPGVTIRFREVVTGYDLDTLEKHVVYLTQKLLVERVAQGFLAIRLEGVEEYEAAVSQPEQPTEHFPPVVIAENYLHVSGDISGQVQVGTTGSTQTMGVSPDDLRTLVFHIRAIVEALMLEPDEAAEIEADLRTVEAQADSPKPKSGIVREALSSTRTVLEGVAAKEIASGAEHLPSLIERIGHAVSLLT